MKFLGHPLHQLLIVFPVGLLLTAVAFELIALWNGSSELWTVSYWLILAGLVSGLVAAIFGFLDWRHIPSSTRANRIGIYHAAGNVLVLTVFALSWWLRGEPAEAASSWSLGLALIGAGLLGLTGWLGAELIVRLGVGVDQDANVNASNSLAVHAPIEATTSIKHTA
jgi:uncharacterized membrane protein